MGNKYYVYMFVNWDWNAPFYIGKGHANRYKDLTGRSRQIVSIWESYNCSSHIIQYCDNEGEAYRLERHYKEMYKNIGYPIIDNENYSATLRQRAGIERAKLEGKYKGRKTVNIPDFSIHYERYMSRQTTKSQLARDLKISRPTLDKLIKDFERENDIQ